MRARNGGKSGMRILLKSEFDKDSSIRLPVLFPL
jgi:hypothetical protein